MSNENGASLWLTTLPIKEDGFQLDKQSFWDLLKIRYGFRLPRLSEKCACGSLFNLQHALSCKKGGFIAQRHNTLRNVTARLMTEVCKDVKVKPPLHPLRRKSSRKDCEQVNGSTSRHICEGFLGRWPKSILRCRVFNPIAPRYSIIEIKEDV